ncbi:hypothetical protein CGRA01v4_07224 [Colletotrichum graminicola]|nr:hypothetical protein CGRA01v4_07224 [Colletotrichum graminicola]
MNESVDMTPAGTTCASRQTTRALPGGRSRNAARPALPIRQMESRVRPGNRSLVLHLSNVSRCMAAANACLGSWWSSG